ncbi:MAG TPA: exonuclease SbcCD subunit D C-terminal domain-containing protein, partial [Clostridia bacterium]|nr:exonuclease SbcCD subunit D C-terminal domain-containing protein [Clostridia bacterium]
GVDSVDADLFSGFDYVALGHLHGPQRVGRETVRYAGSPLKYSFSECRHQKSACLVTLEARGAPEVRLIPLKPRRNLRKIRGPLAALVSPEVAGQGDAEDYLHITLTDEDEPMDALDTLRAVYPNVMALAFDNARTRALAELSAPAPVAQADPQALFAEFFAQLNGRDMNAVQARIVRDLLTETGGNA